MSGRNLSIILIVGALFFIAAPSKGLVPVAAGGADPLSSAIAQSPTAPDPAAPCIRHLTFRWTSSSPIRLDVTHPADIFLKNAPFLVDPEIVSVAIGNDRFGSNLTIRLGASAGAILAVESSTHVGQQMLIMLGDTVITAAMVRETIHDIMVLNGPDVQKLELLAGALRATPDNAARCAISWRPISHPKRSSRASM
jgi:hypothetical protein